MFVQGGGVNPGDFLSNAGGYGDYWSSVGRNSPTTYTLYFNSGSVNPSAGSVRYYGFSLRCVALGG